MKYTKSIIAGLIMSLVIAGTVKAAIPPVVPTTNETIDNESVMIQTEAKEARVELAKKPQKTMPPIAHMKSIVHGELIQASLIETAKESGETIIETVTFETPVSVVEEAEADSAAVSPTITLLSDSDIEILAKTLYGEANSVESKAERSMVVWTILNRLDDGGFGSSIEEICTAPYQFTGYSFYHPITDENLSLVYDVVGRWEREKNGEENVGRTLPQDILYFHSDSSSGWHNAYYRYEFYNQGARIYFDRNNPIENPYES